MLEAFILWQVVQARREAAARETRPEGLTALEIVLFLRWLVTVFIWPVNATYRFGLWKLNKAVAISVAVVVIIFFGLAEPAIYLLAGVMWASFEAAAWISKNAEEERRG